jgi:hypothetical protein
VAFAFSYTGFCRAKAEAYAPIKGSPYSFERTKSSIQVTTNAPTRRSVMRSPARIAAKKRPGRFFERQDIFCGFSVLSTPQLRSACGDQRHLSQLKNTVSAKSTRSSVNIRAPFM